MDLLKISPATHSVDTILQSEIPIVISGEAADWPCTAAWTWEFLRRECHNVQIPMIRACGSAITHCGIHTIIEDILGGGDCYGIDWDFAAQFPEFLTQVPGSQLSRSDCFKLLPKEFRPRFQELYLGGRNTGSPLHQDSLRTHAWMAVLRGQKRWVLYPPKTFKNQKSVRNYNAFAESAAEADISEGRQRYEVVIGAGDVIFIPSMWWHQVLNTEPTLGLTVNFCSPSIRSSVIREAGRSQACYISETSRRVDCAELARELRLLLP